MDNTEENQTEESGAATEQVVAEEKTQLEADDSPAPAAFWDGFSDESLKANPSVRKHRSVEALAKSYVELSKKLGSKGLEPLPKDATPELIEARKTIMRGENIKSSKDYSWKLSEYDKAVLGEEFDGSVMKEALFNAGFNDEQFGAAMNAFASVERGRKEAVKNNIETCDKALREQWGDDYDINMKANEIFMSKRFPAIHKNLSENGAYHIPEVANMIKTMNELTADGEIRIQRATEKSYNEKLDDVVNSDAYKQSWHPLHEAAVNRRTELIMEIARRKHGF